MVEHKYPQAELVKIESKPNKRGTGENHYLTFRVNGEAQTRRLYLSRELLEGVPAMGSTADVIVSDELRARIVKSAQGDFIAYDPSFSVVRFDKIAAAA